MKALLAYYFNLRPEVEDIRPEVGEIDSHGRTALHYAAKSGETERVVELKELDAWLEAKDKEGKTPLHYAAEYGNVETVTKLKELGAFLEAKDNDGRTPLHYAAKYGKKETVATLLALGATLEAKDSWERTPLHYAAWHGEVKTVAKLLKAGATIEAKDSHGSTPLHYAAAHGGTDLVAQLELSTILGVTDNHKRIPLHYAVERTEIVTKLKELGASLEARDNDGKTPLHRAIKKENVVKLLELGANINAEDKEGKTPLFYAEKKRDSEIVALLKSWQEKEKSASTLSESASISSHLKEEKQSQIGESKILIAKAIEEVVEKQPQDALEALQQLHLLQAALEQQEIAVSALEQQLVQLQNNKDATEEIKQTLKAKLTQHKQEIVDLTAAQQALKTEQHAHFRDLYALYADLAEKMIPLQKDYLSRSHDIKLKEQIDTALLLIQAPGNEKLQSFYRYLSLKITEMLIGDKAIGSGKVEQSKGTKEMFFSKTIYIAGELIPIPGAGIVAEIINSISSEVISKYKKSKAESRSAAGGGMQDILVLPNLLAASFTLHLHDQIKKLTKAGGERAAEMAMLRSAVALQMIDPTQPVAERVKEIVRICGDLPELCKRFGLKNRKLEIEAVPVTVTVPVPEERPWTEGMFIRCGRQVVTQDAQGNERRKYYSRTLYDYNEYRSTRRDNKYGHAYVTEEEVRQPCEWTEVRRYQQPSTAVTPPTPVSTASNLSAPSAVIQVINSVSAHANSTSALLPAVQLINKDLGTLENKVLQLEKQNTYLMQAMEKMEKQFEQRLQQLEMRRPFTRSKSFTEMLNRNYSQSKVSSTSLSKV